MMLSSKVFTFCQGEEFVKVVIPENVDPAYGMYVWPCAPVLAQYIWFHRQHFEGKHVIELGAGTALPGVMAAKCGAVVTLTDSELLPECLDNGQHSFQANGLTPAQVLGVTWGLFSPGLLELEPVDFVLASDCFYDTKDFEDIIVTVSFILQKNPKAQFLCTYQERSSDRSIEHLLMKWNMQCQRVPLEDFSADSPTLAGSNLPGNHTIQMLIMSLKSR